jgi:hypothetical protein
MSLILPMLPEVTPRPFELDQHTFFCGGKMLIIHESSEYGLFSSYVAGTDKNKRLSRETTALYVAAHQMMQTRTNELGHAMKYEFQTSNTEMEKWAQAIGGSVFDWVISRSPKDHFMDTRVYHPVA